MAKTQKYHLLGTVGTEGRTPLRLKLLGGFEAVGPDGAEISLPTRKARLLLAFLANPPGRAHSRDRLTELLWGDRAEEQARGSLRNALTAIRKQIGGDAIVTDGDTVALAFDSVWVDVADFELCLLDRTPEALQAAAELYGGDLLDGAGATETPYLEWLMVESTRLRDLALGALAELLDYQAATGAFVEAIGTARRALTVDPVREDLHRVLMRLYAAAGQRGLAIRQYELCRNELSARLSVAPESTTDTLYEAVRTEPAAMFAAEFVPTRSHANAEVRAEPKSAAEPVPADTADAEAPASSTGDKDATPMDDAVASERPSVAVLPFKNLSDTAEHDFLADGLAEDITAGLSRFRWFFVIARGSAFSYKGRTVGAQDAARELGVRYIVGGSIRRAGPRIRVSADLIDAATGATVWAERFESVVEDIFDLQDEIAERIVATLEPELSNAELQRARRKPPQDLDTWSCFQRGLASRHLFTIEGLDDAYRLFKMAIEQDPTFATAFAELAYVGILKIILGHDDDPKAALAEAEVAARRAIVLDPRDSVGHFAQGRVYLFQQAHQRALDEMELALECNPNSARAHFGLGTALVYGGRPADGIAAIEKAIRLNPRDPNVWSYLVMLGRAHFNMGQYEEAVVWARKAMQQPNSHYWPLAHAAAALGHLGRDDEAAEAVGALLRMKPDFTVDLVRRTIGQYGANSCAEQIIDGLRRAGLEQ
ncbi:MAG: hypothetical protein GY791_09445 [Alphaproteobacteria bacterium]|nr:hypothetical protein [Alphaproteobacteria bacterium]